MTQLGGERDEELKNMISQLEKVLQKNKLEPLDANSIVTGRDFHTKIWKLALSVPIGIAVITDKMRQSTILNIFYEIGLMNALGKETIVIKNRDFNVPSDLVRTEYIEYNDAFDEKFQKFIDRTFEVADYYVTMAENLLAKPILSLDYLRRAYLISAKEEIKERAKEIILTHPFDEHTNLMIRNYFNIKEFHQGIK